EAAGARRLGIDRSREVAAIDDGAVQALERGLEARDTQRFGAHRGAAAPGADVGRRADQRDALCGRLGHGSFIVGGVNRVSHGLRTKETWRAPRTPRGRMPGLPSLRPTSSTMTRRRS